ncbi:hypothetical protein FA09DRAFT_361770 [Tilletiopsis washingtonensis]|uniref:Uncharacterized protein n=1 Tax=Tilletiopsis washingtonensis TaxID=58919 RepID=A0A316Z6D4_9BASI|nr:hypothetical protein FA09DRAFT_361770 [Tilletiopsis washingtonensis]PWN96614.1 hypothetical protein FA09DRAFT_361770 [Tilletiopsis washingtonensis]
MIIYSYTQDHLGNWFASAPPVQYGPPLQNYVWERNAGRWVPIFALWAPPPALVAAPLPQILAPAQPVGPAVQCRCAAQAQVQQPHAQIQQPQAQVQQPDAQVQQPDAQVQTLLDLQEKAEATAAWTRRALRAALPPVVAPPAQNAAAALHEPAVAAAAADAPPFAHVVELDEEAAEQSPVRSESGPVRRCEATAARARKPYERAPEAARALQGRFDEVLQQREVPQAQARAVKAERKELRHFKEE